MKALILGAGRGKRMRPLTDTLPKPLLIGAGKRLIQWQIESLVRAGITEVVINTAHLSECFPRLLGRQAYGAHIEYSKEGDDFASALETLGGIVKALPLLTDGQEPFLVVAGDIVTDFDYRQLMQKRQALLQGTIDAHLVLVENPPFHPQGDMGLENGLVRPDQKDYTFSSLGIYSPRLFQGLPITYAKLFPWLYEACRRDRVSAQLYLGRWDNVGTPQALKALQPLPSHPH